MANKNKPGWKFGQPPVTSRKVMQGEVKKDDSNGTPVTSHVNRVVLEEPDDVKLPLLDITPRNLYQGVVYAEIFGKPKSMRRGR